MRSTRTVAETDSGITFTFPGQGSYSYAVLRELYFSYAQTVPYFELANEIARELLKGDFLSLITAPSQKEHDERLNACPDLDQVGIYLTEVLIARILIESGVRPSLLVGHSFGELAALATADVFSIETGLRIVCHRVSALQSMARPGVMAAVSCNFEQAQQFLAELKNNSIEVAVINQPRQTVLSGHRQELEELCSVLNQRGISLTFLSSRYPYHSSFLERAVEPYRTALQSYKFRPASIPVYLCLEGTLYSPGSYLPQILSSQFVRRFEFKNVVQTLYDSGYRTFIECGAGNIVSRLIEQNLADKIGEVTVLTTTAEGSSKQSLPEISARFGALEAKKSAGELLESVSQVVNDMFRLVESTSCLVKEVAGSLAKPAQLESYPPETTLKPDLSQTKEPLEERPAKTLASSASGNNGFSAPSPKKPDQQSASIPEVCNEMPIAIVSMGCVLPGAFDCEQYWSNVLNGVSGISNLADVDPNEAIDFLAPTDGPQIKITPDKSYTLLHGGISNVPYDAELLPPAYTQNEFDCLTKGQKLLALSIAQSLRKLETQAELPKPKRVHVILGATADGSKEYDDALFLDSVETLLGTLDQPDSARRAFVEQLEQVSGYAKGDSEKLTQHRIYSDVVEKLLGSGITTYVVDTACSSSLYSIHLGMRALQDGHADLIFAGGVFAPGPANNTLFAQFRGLTARESRPFDIGADGVVFGDGAGIAILKRLPDALAAGNRILAVIRAVGLSSDGRSPSINVPQSKGQGLAIRSAYERSGIDLNSIQYVEAHATATTVGDAVEFNALKETMTRDPNSPPIELGSVKALVGHTGWAAGMASVIKLCKAFETRTIPRQYNYIEPSPEIDLAHSQFKISTVSSPWPANVDRYPRRAAINGFGFGGTNAHLILEEFDKTYHQNLCSNLSVKERIPTKLAVVGLGSLFPGPDGSLATSPASQLSFRRESLRLPAKKMLLPDVTEHMDASQFLISLTAEQTFAGMPDAFTRLKNVTGVVLGIESKTERGARANERIFADRLRRRISQHQGNGANHLLDQLLSLIRSRNIPSGPYTLPGLMPNVTAGRIANMFDLHGPNLVIDMGSSSLVQSFFVARQLLTHHDCKIVLAGGINARNGNDAEAALLLALTTPETALEEGLPILTTVSLSESHQVDQAAKEIAEINPGLNYRGARLAPEIVKAIDTTRQHNTSARIAINGFLTGNSLVFSSPSASAREAQPRGESTGAYAFVQGTPIGYYTPQLRPAKANGEPKILKDRRILFLVDQPEYWLTLESSGALEAFEYKVVCPNRAHLAKSLAIDLESDESIRNSLSGLAGFEFDILIAIKTLAGYTNETLLSDNSENELQWIDSLFALCRHSYETLQSKNIPVVAVCLSAYRNDQLDPFTGLASGFMKSLARELNGPVCRIIDTDESNFYRALRQVENELGQLGNDEVEVCYKEGIRSTFALAPVEHLAQADHQQCVLDSNSVVIATGGARGVTAVLVEDLLSKFGCRVIALGRTDPDAAPENVRAMDEQAFKDYEPQFYREELARNKGRKITDLKKDYLSYRAANEVCQVTKQLQAISEKYEYQCVDITDEAAIDQVVGDTYRKYGRVDLVLHGAGVQVSRVLTKKSISDFRRIVNTKLGGLRHLYKACEKYRKDHPIHFHILTSAFSYMGNDGQPDYGAANEAMNRIAACMNSPLTGTTWSAMAWLGWAGIGMTRDSEFAALAAARRLRGVTKEEGQQIFSEMMKGRPTTPINVLLADGEIDYYKVAILDSPAKVVARSVNGKHDFYKMEQEISVATAPYLVNHLVDGVPTLPGAFVISVFAEAALQLRPNLKIVSFEKAGFHRFTKVYENRKARIRVEAQIAYENTEESLVQVRILSDFVHSSGLVLQKDVLQHEILVRMSPGIPTAPRYFETNGDGGLLSPDPYTLDGSPVSLSGPFDAIQNLTIGEAARRAGFKYANFDNAKDQSALSRIVLMDSLWRFGVIQAARDNSMTVFVPEACEVMKVYFDFAEFDVSKHAPSLTFRGTNPRPDGERLHMGPVAAIDDGGNTLLMVERGICRRFGEVKNGYAAFSHAV